MMKFPVHLHPLEAGAQQLGELLAVFALAAAHDGRQQIEAGAFRQLQQPVHHLGHGLTLDGKARGGGVGGADARPQKAHVVVNLGDRAHGGTRIATGRLLLDGNGRREALDGVHVRFLHHLQKLAGVGRKALHVAPLPLGIDCIEGQRTLA